MAAKDRWGRKGRIKHRRRHRRGTWCMRGVLSPRGESHARLLGSPAEAEEMGATAPWRGWVCMCARVYIIYMYIRIHPDWLIV